MLKCDFCEEESDIAGFDPDWDAVVCKQCSDELDDEMSKAMEDAAERMYVRKQRKRDGNKTA